MQDSNAKVPSGILHGNIHQYGHFEQCLSIVANSGNIQGQFCLTNVQFIIPDSLCSLKLLMEKFALQEMFQSTFRDVSQVISRELMKNLQLYEMS